MAHVLEDMYHDRRLTPGTPGGLACRPCVCPVSPSHTTICPRCRSSTRRPGSSCGCHCVDPARHRHHRGRCLPRRGSQSCPGAWGRDWRTEIGAHLGALGLDWRAEIRFSLGALGRSKGAEILVALPHQSHAGKVGGVLLGTGAKCFPLNLSQFVEG
jgi:hypothetical protein